MSKDSLLERENMMEYSIGKMAKISGCSAKAIRIYEKKGLLSGRRDEKNQYRVFDDRTMVQLQRIQMLKYLGFSLEQIKIFTNQFDNLSLEYSLQTQKRLLEQKRKMLDSMISCVETGIMECREKTFVMDEFFESMNAIQKNRKADEQVWQLSCLADEPKGWSRWAFAQAELGNGMKVLDAGAGWGNLWRYNREKIQEQMQITCVDRHNTHADALEKYTMEEGLKNFQFIWNDLETMEFSEKYDRIFFNHVIRYIHQPISLYKKFCRVLSRGGVFICTWGGSLLFHEVTELLVDFPEGRKYFHAKLDSFEKGLQENEEDLKKVFSTVERRCYELNLRFSSVEELADYLITFVHGEIRSEQMRRELIDYLSAKVDGKEILIRRDTYLYRCQKGGEGKCHLD